MLFTDTDESVNSKAFEGAVFAAASYLRIDAVRQAVRAFRPPFYPFHVSKCVERAVEINRLLSESTVAARKPPLDLKDSSRANANRRRREWETELRPFVDALRAGLFEGSTAAPFASRDGAADWIEKNGITRGQSRLYNHECARIQDTLDTLNTEPTGTRLFVGRESMELSYWKGADVLASMAIGPSGPLHDLWAMVTQLSELTRTIDIRAADLVNFVLTGDGRCFGERLGRVNLRANVGHFALLDGKRSMVVRRQLSIDLDPRDVTDAHFRMLSKRVRVWLGIGGRKSRSSKGWWLVETVKALGGPPTPRFAAHFWETVRRSQGSPYVQSTWRAAAVAYYRTTRKVGPRTTRVNRPVG